jgi:hypothetical protein
VPDKVGSDAFRVGPKLIDEFRIPIMVKITGPESCSRYFLAVTTTVTVIRRLQRLVHVADEVDKKLEANDLCFGGGGRICQLGCELVNLIDHAVGGWTVRGHGARWDGPMIEAGCIEVRSGDLDINEVRSTLVGGVS